MEIETFEVGRLQSLWEIRVDYNLTESGIHPYTLLDVRLGYGWTNGEPALRELVASYYPGATADNVLITNGSAEANFLAMWTLLEPGDEVAVMVPNYLQIWGIARSLGVTVKTFRLQEDRAWVPDLDELKAVVSERTRAIVICNPNNPTGAGLSRTDMDAIVEIANSVGAIVYADEVYKGVELDGNEGPSFRDLDHGAIVAAGLSKALAHSGLRIGQDSASADWWGLPISSHLPGSGMTTPPSPPQARCPQAARCQPIVARRYWVRSRLSRSRSVSPPGRPDSPARPAIPRASLAVVRRAPTVPAGATRARNAPGDDSVWTCSDLPQVEAVAAAGGPCLQDRSSGHGDSHRALGPPSTYVDFYAEVRQRLPCSVIGAWPGVAILRARH